MDISALSSLNDSAKVLYDGLEDRSKVVAKAASLADQHAQEAKRVSQHMRELACAAHNIEALVERLDEYTGHLEDRLSHAAL